MLEIFELNSKWKVKDIKTKCKDNKRQTTTQSERQKTGKIHRNKKEDSWIGIELNGDFYTFFSHMGSFVWFVLFQFMGAGHLWKPN